MVFILEIPHIRGAELISAIKFKLSGLYPGNIDENNIQIRKNGNKKWEYLVFVLNKDTGHTMLTLSPLFVRHVFAKKTANVLYIDKRWLDYTRIDNGVIQSSMVKIKDESKLIDDVKNFCSAETELIIYCDENDKMLLSPLQSNNNILFLDAQTELKRTDVHKISLFTEKSAVIKIRRGLIAVIILSLLVMCIFMFNRQREKEKEFNALQRLEQEQLEKANLEKQRETQKLTELKLQYQEIISSKTAAPFDIAVVIAECAGHQTRIQSATINGSFFQIEGISGNSLDLLRKFENHRLVDSARLHQVHPDNNRDAFTLSGTVHKDKAPFDESRFSSSELIALLEDLINTEKNYTLSETRLSPSSFGEAVKTLFTKWGCTVNSYQFMNETQKTEIEYSLRGPGNGFFNALYEIKTNHRLWDIHLTQIRNLYPRNMLDIVLRIRTEYHQSNTGDTSETPVNENSIPYPVANISRNYFPPAQGPRIPREPAVIMEQVPPAKTEKVLWLEYVGTVNDDSDYRFIYVKNTKTGEILKLGQFSEGNMRYAISPSGSIMAFIDDRIYEINRR
jgi:competence protein ComGC